MSENSWVLRGVDPETRQWAVEEAERRGITVSDFLTQVLLGGSIAEETPPTEDRFDDEPLFMQPPETPRENFAFRHRVEALERRLGLSIGGLDSAMHALDSTVFGIAGRVDETEALTHEHAAALAEMAASVSALRKRLADAEDSTESLGESVEAADAELAHRLAQIDAHLRSVDQLAQTADARGIALAGAHDALQRALAQDFNDFAIDQAEQLEGARADMRAIADDGARHADAAVARALDALRITREAIEDNVAAHAAETRARVQDAFADAADRLAALADRVLDNERAITRHHEQLSARLIDVEDGAQVALEETAESLRQADAALATEIARTAQDARTALDAAYGEISTNLAEITERQLGGLARVKLIDSALTNTINDVATLRDNVAQDVAAVVETVRQRQAQGEAEWDARFAAIAARIGDTDRQVNHTAQALSADIARVETCTFAALEKLAGDIRSGDSKLDDALTDAREQQAGAYARLKLIDKAIGAQDLVDDVERGAAPLVARIAELEAAVRAAPSDHALQALAAEVERLSAYVSDLRAKDTAAAVAALTLQVGALANQKREDEGLVLQRVDDLRARLTAQEQQASEAADRLHGIARMLGRVTAQNADASTQSEERLHKLELALADLRLEGYASSEGVSVAASDAISALAERLENMEQRQVDAFESLRADIAHFIGENDRRLEALEQGGHVALTGDDVLIARAIEARLSSLEQRDIGAEFETLRKRVEERVLGVEGRSIRALEQVGETIALIERRAQERDEALARSA